MQNRPADEVDHATWKRLERLSVKRLVREALGNGKAHVFARRGAWPIVEELRRRATREVFAEAKRLCQSTRAVERALGVDILSRLGSPRKFASQTARLLTEMVKRERSISVLESIGFALAELEGPSVVDALVCLAGHENPKVRFSAARAMSERRDPRIVEAQLKLVKDTDDNTSNWATFGLGQNAEADSPRIREALLGRLGESDGEIVGEALLGLALRKDERVLAPLIDELESERAGRLSVLAAMELANRRLLPALNKLSDWWDDDDDEFNAAYDACAAEGLENAVGLCDSGKPEDRKRGVEWMGETGFLGRRTRSMSQRKLLEMAREEREPEVLEALAVALVSFNETGPNNVLRKLSRHENARVRSEALSSLAAVGDPNDCELFVSATLDADGEARENAMTGLSLLECDTPQVREVLAKGLEDKNSIVVAEAIAGLARRGDERAFAPLLSRLKSHDVLGLDLIAARDMADQRLLRALEGLRERFGDDDQQLNEALEACRKGSECGSQTLKPHRQAK